MTVCPQFSHCLYLAYCQLSLQQSHIYKTAEFNNAMCRSLELLPKHLLVPAKRCGVKPNDSSDCLLHFVLEPFIWRKTVCIAFKVFIKTHFTTTHLDLPSFSTSSGETKQRPTYAITTMFVGCHKRALFTI